MQLARIAILIGAALLPMMAIAQTPSRSEGSVLGAAEALKPGEYLWAPEVAPQGPLLLIVSIATQRATLYHGGCSTTPVVWRICIDQPTTRREYRSITTAR